MLARAHAAQFVLIVLISGGKTSPFYKYPPVKFSDFLMSVNSQREFYGQKVANTELEPVNYACGLLSVLNSLMSSAVIK